ncbi:hypothetical protein FRAHR75_140014 [Frankia sp. Hr75.2]|nr:hypothetical protein FRAHR75_140014 [Frankia sp. Hr75.2]SQD97493.1 hypothetical protein FMEAI12_4190005 [Parafrankia sp. Ea1.12]
MRWPGTNEAISYGPLPTTSPSWDAGLPPGMITRTTPLTRAGRSYTGAVSAMVAVRASVALLAFRSIAAIAAPLSVPANVAKLASTSAVVNGLPSEKVIPGFSLSVQTVASALGVRLSNRRGVTEPSGWASPRRSYTARPRTEPRTSCPFTMSRVSAGLLANAARSFPPRRGAAAPAAPVAGTAGSSSPQAASSAGAVRAPTASRPARPNARRLRATFIEVFSWGPVPPNQRAAKGNLMHRPFA